MQTQMFNKRIQKAKTIIFFFALGVLNWFNTNAQEARRYSDRLWYTQPAENWMMQALPIGNGRVGAMIFGGVQTEHLQFNEKTVWSGKVNRGETENKNLMNIMPQFQELLANGEIVKMDSLYQSFQPSTKMQIPREDFGAYQPFGDIFIHFKGQEGNPVDYIRELDLEKGIATVRYQLNGVNYTRTYFCSYPDQVLVVQLSADQPQKLSADITGEMPDAPQGNVENSENNILFSGLMPHSGLQYNAQLQVFNDGGQIKSEGDRTTVSNANSITLILAANTNYQMKWPQAIGDVNPAAICSNQVKEATNKGYNKLLERHEEDYTALFSKVKLNLPRAEEREKLPTDQRLIRYTACNKEEGVDGGDPGLEALLFQYGRYLLISSSRGNTLPANLQGLWNNSPSPAWDSDYHTDINLEMNYWSAGPANLNDCFGPLVQYIDFLKTPGRLTAKDYFNARGFFINIYTNPWGYAGPRWLWSGAAGWLCQNLYDHFTYSGDYDYLKESAYPTMKETCEFYMDLLYPYKGGKQLVISPSISPEINFKYNDGKNYRISAGAAIDQQIVYDLFTNTIEASKALGIKGNFTDSLNYYLERLSPPVQVRQNGAIQEWVEDWPAEDPQHRHISHLYALYPGRMINPGTTPEWAEAAQKSLELRGDNHTGWGTAWRIACYARLGNGEKAYDFFKSLIRHCTDTHIVYRGGGGAYDNLLTCHSPFQIDSNFGFTAAVAEMLLQSQLGNWTDGYTLDILPALPLAWSNGSVSGLKARGNVEVDLQWQNHRLTRVELRANDNQTFKIKYGELSKSIKLKKGQRLVLDGKLNLEVVKS